MIEDLTISELLERAAAYEKEHASRAMGGRKSAQNMTEEQRKARAKKAAQARWKNEKGK